MCQGRRKDANTCEGKLCPIVTVPPCARPHYPVFRRLYIIHQAATSLQKVLAVLKKRSDMPSECYLRVTLCPGVTVASLCDCVCGCVAVTVYTGTKDADKLAKSETISTAGITIVNELTVAATSSPDGITVLLCKPESLVKLKEASSMSMLLFCLFIIVIRVCCGIL